MRITEVKIRLWDDHRLKALASIVLDDVLLVRWLMVIKLRGRYSVSMPGKTTEGKYEEIAHPMTGSVWRFIESAVLKEYWEEVRRWGERDDDLSSDVPSPILPKPGPLQAGAARKLEWDSDDDCLPGDGSWAL